MFGPPSLSLILLLLTIKRIFQWGWNSLTSPSQALALYGLCSLEKGLNLASQLTLFRSIKWKDCNIQSEAKFTGSDPNNIMEHKTSRIFYHNILWNICTQSLEKNPVQMVLKVSSSAYVVSLWEMFYFRSSWTQKLPFPIL